VPPAADVVNLASLHAGTRAAVIATPMIWRRERWHPILQHTLFTQVGRESKSNAPRQTVHLAQRTRAPSILRKAFNLYERSFRGEPQCCAVAMPETLSTRTTLSSRS